MNKTSMEYKGFKARIMEAERLVGDYLHELPPGRPLDVYHSDEFEKWPENWMKGPGVFLVPVRADKGLWFDWTENSPVNTAIIPTVKGSNPITGMPTSGFYLEHYQEKCPKHKKPFIADRFCEECGYKWPSQNYVGPGNILWQDGWFNTTDGTVRQFFFTEEMMRDIATHKIGKENTVPAFGFAFFAPKERRAEPAMTTQYIYHNVSSGFFGGDVLYSASCSQIGGHKGMSAGTSHTKSAQKYSKGLTKGSLSNDMCFEGVLEEPSGGIISSYNTSDSSVLMACAAGASADAPAEAAAPDSVDFERSKSAEPSIMAKVTRSRSFSKSFGMRSLVPDKDVFSQERCVEKVEIKEVAVGAGARIRQDIALDPYQLDTYKDKPESVMTIYFVFHAQFEQMKAAGMRDLVGNKEGMLAGLPVG